MTELLHSYLFWGILYGSVGFLVSSLTVWVYDMDLTFNDDHGPLGILLFVGMLLAWPLMMFNLYLLLLKNMGK